MNSSSFKVLGIWQLLKRLSEHISVPRKRQFVALLVLTLVSSVAEFVSIGAVLPFIAVLTEPERVLKLPMIAGVARAVGISGSANLVVPLTVGFALAALFAGCLRLLLLWLSTRLGNATGTDLSIAIYERTLHQPYRVHISRPSSEIISGITQKVATATGVLTSAVAILISSVLFLSILATLVIINPIVACFAALSFGSAYATIAVFTRRRLRHNGECIAREQTEVVRTLQEGLGAIRDVLLDGTQAVYRSIYQRARVRLQLATAENTFINEAPRYAMEALGMALIATFVLMLSEKRGGVTSALPTLAAMALGAQRLLPLMQQLYGHWSVVAGSHAALADVLVLLDQPMPGEALLSASKAYQVGVEIRCDRVWFRYSPDGPWILEDVSLTIPRGARVGFFGSTGAGKSTLLDVVMGLLDPTRGVVAVDGIGINQGNLRSWQRNIAHVPQSIFLTDGTIAENIAFGVPTGHIDRSRLQRASDLARLSEFIDRCEQGFDTRVGERGVRLSGGQRQRIGIARALYKDAGLLILDEATSALDSDTEQAVMEGIEGLGEHLIVLMIAHRLTTLRNCGLIVRIDRGRIVEQLTYAELARGLGVGT